MRVGLFDHFGYAVAVTVTDDHEVVDRRRIALVADDVTDAPVHYDIRNLDDDAAVALLERWRTSVREVVRAELDGLPAGIVEMCLRDFPDEYPNDPSTLRNDPYNARADAVFYRQLLAEAADARGWSVFQFDAKSIEGEAAAVIGVIPKLGPPWSKERAVRYLC